MNIQEALEAGRFTKGSFTGCDVKIEALVPEETRAELKARGHDFRVAQPRSGTFGYGQAVMSGPAVCTSAARNRGMMARRFPRRRRYSRRPASSEGVRPRRTQRRARERPGVRRPVERRQLVDQRRRGQQPLLAADPDRPRQCRQAPGRLDLRQRRRIQGLRDAKQSHRHRRSPVRDDADDEGGGGQCGEWPGDLEVRSERGRRCPHPIPPSRRHRPRRSRVRHVSQLPVRARQGYAAGRFRRSVRVAASICARASAEPPKG